jgi:hypothetical protein
MKVLCLITWTDCENKHRSLSCVGHEVHVHQYDDRPHDRHGELIDVARDLRPDFIVMVGAVEQYHGRPVLRPDTLCRMREVAPTVLMCNDAGDPPWWPTLEDYYNAGSFSLYVSIDGSKENPIAKWPNGLLALTPTDFLPFKPRPWGERDIRLGMVGGMGHRNGMIEQMMSRGMDFREGPSGRTYDEFAEILCRTKVTFCYGITGSMQRFHVKGRVVEAGLAGSVLLDVETTPTRDWFEPDVEYIPYRDPDDAVAKINALSDEQLRAMADRFHRKVVEEHHPAAFWNKVIARLGLS